MKFSHLRCFRRALFGSVLSWAAVGLAWATEVPTGSGTVRPQLVPAEMLVAPEGLEVTVWAASPQLFNPTNFDIDGEGRIWVAEGVNYRGHARRRPEGDRIVVLIDVDQDGKADSSHTFVQEPALIAPLGIAVFENQIVVSQPPDLIVYTDVNRDLKFDPAVDRRETLLTGFNGRNHDHSLHSVTAGPDGLWYWNQGNTGALFTDKSGRTFRIGSPYNHAPGTRQVADATEIAGQRSDDGHVWIGGFTARMKPDGTEVTIIGHNYRNSYEQTISSFGDIFQSDNDDPPACRVTALIEFGNAGFASRDGQRAWRADMRPGQTVQIAEWRQEDPGTMPSGDVYGGGSPTGVAFYENGALGEKWRGLLLACEAGRNVVFGYLPQPAGAGFKLERFDFLTSNKEKQFAGSDFLGGARSVNHELKTLFRPSDVAVGPDGAVYVSDWFDARVGGHSDLDAATSGAIYRIAPLGFRTKAPRLDLSTSEGQIEALRSPAVNVRLAGFKRLRAEGSKAVEPVAALLKEKNPFIAARALWLLAQMGPEGLARVVPQLESKEESMRLAAYRALRRANHQIVPIAERMAADASAAVRREVALAMRNAPLPESEKALLQVARRFDGKDRSYLEAFGLGCTGKEAEVYSRLRGEQPEAEKWSDGFAWIAWRLGAPAAVPDIKARALSAQLSSAQRKLMTDALAFIRTKEAARAMADLAGAKDFPHQALALWWLFNRKNSEWRDFGLDEVLKERGLYDPERVELAQVMMPEEPAVTSALPPVAEILRLKGDAKRGLKAVVVCYSCHRIDNQGVDFGPDLTAFGKTQTSEVLLNAMLDPSAEISHGFDGSELIAKDGTIIHGIVLSNGDPVIIASMAGQVQTVPRSKVASIKKLNRSLMFSAEMLGLSPQSMMDIVEYLKAIGSKQ